MLELNPEHLKAVIHAINLGPFFQHMSMRVIDLGTGYSIVEVDICREHRNPFGGIHGGVYAAAIDTAAYWSAYCDLPEDTGLVSMDLKVDFLAPVSDQRVIITAETIKSGKTIYLAEAKMTDINGKILGHGTSKLMVTPSKQSMSDVVAYMGLDNLPQKFRRNGHGI